MSDKTKQACYEPAKLRVSGCLSIFSFFSFLQLGLSLWWFEPSCLSVFTKHSALFYPYFRYIFSFLALFSACLICAPSWTLAAMHIDGKTPHLRILFAMSKNLCPHFIFLRRTDQHYFCKFSQNFLCTEERNPRSF